MIQITLRSFTRQRRFVFCRVLLFVVLSIFATQPAIAQSFVRAPSCSPCKFHIHPSPLRGELQRNHCSVRKAPFQIVGFDNSGKIVRRRCQFFVYARPRCTLAHDLMRVHQSLLALLVPLTACVVVFTLRNSGRQRLIAPALVGLFVVAGLIYGSLSSLSLVSYK